MKKAHHATDVIVIGAGIAGLSAARMLAEAGKSVLLLEAANRIGGRIRSQTVVGSSEPIELGAEFIHGLPEDLLKLLKQADLETYELTGHSYSWEKESLHAEHEEDGKDDSRILDHLGDFLRRDVSQDVSFAAYLDQHPFSAAERERLTGYVEGFNAADATRISTQALGFQQAAENEIDGDRLLHVRSGYSSLPAFVFSKYEQAGGKVRFQHRVDRIQWAKDHVTVTATVADETMIFTSRCVVIAVPLGVLQEGSVAITPWPEHLHAMTQMAMGQVHRISMIFKERFWSHQPHEANDLSFLFARQLTPSVWWTSYPSKTPVLTAWIGGTRVKETEASHLLETTLASLAHIFTISRSELGELLVSSHTHDWNNDPLSRGAYSYVCTGGLEASSTMSKPTEGTVFVAGEHTDVTGHWGTVHGALRSGIRAARQVIEALGS